MSKTRFRDHFKEQTRLSANIALIISPLSWAAVTQYAKDPINIWWAYATGAVWLLMQTLVMLALFAWDRKKENLRW